MYRRHAGICPGEEPCFHHARGAGRRHLLFTSQVNNSHGSTGYRERRESQGYATIDGGLRDAG